MTNTGGVRLGRLVVMLVALAMWAVPATALAQDSDDDNNQSGSNGGAIDQDQGGSSGGGAGIGGGNGGGGDGSGGGSGGDDNDGVGGDGGPLNQQQNATIQQCNVNAGDDGICDQSNVTNQVINGSIGGAGGAGVSGRGGAVRVHGVGVGGGGVSLARTGFDAWMIALLGGASLAGGLTLLARQRHSS